MKTLEELVNLVLADIAQGQTKTKDQKRILVAEANWHQYNPQQVLRYAGFISGLACHAAFMCPGDAIEIGTDYGMGAVAIGHGLAIHNGRKVYSYDTRPPCVINTNERLERLGLRDHAQCVLGDVYEAHVQFQQAGILPYSFAYIDGWHRFQDCWEDLVNVVDMMHPLGTILCHDMMPAKRQLELAPDANGVRPAVIEFCKLYGWKFVEVGSFAILNKDQ